MIRVGEKVRLIGTKQKATVWGISRKYKMVILDQRLRTHLGWYWTFSTDELEKI